MLTPEQLERRMESAFAYLRARALPPWGDDWEAGLESLRMMRVAERGDPDVISVEAAFVLCDPASWPEPAKAMKDQLLGPKSFGSEAPKADRCEALELFGYECPINPHKLELDHVFPRSLGGQTVVGNSRTLCEYHNRSKGAGIHLYTWEEPVPEWVFELVESVAEHAL